MFRKSEIGKVRRDVRRLLTWLLVARTIDWTHPLVTLWDVDGMNVYELNRGRKG
jgi:hypothetical protein